MSSVTNITPGVLRVGDYEFTPEEIEAARAYEEAIALFEERDAKRGIERDGVLLLGSSTFTLWLGAAREFSRNLSGVPVLNRGFGGSVVSDSLYYIDRVLLPYAPRVVVFYAGDNDLASGKSPQRVLHGTRALIEKTWEQFPETKFVLVSVKPSPSRWNIFKEQTETNHLLQEYSASDARLDYADIVTPMLTPAGNLRPELYVEDELHLTRAGYDIWREVLAVHLQAAV